MNTERKNLTQPADWWEAFSEAARSRGKTLSEWIGDACLAQLTKRAVSELSQRPSTGRPKNSGLHSSDETV